MEAKEAQMKKAVTVLLPDERERSILTEDILSLWFGEWDDNSFGGVDFHTETGLVRLAREDTNVLVYRFVGQVLQWEARFSSLVPSKVIAQTIHAGLTA